MIYEQLPLPYGQGSVLPVTTPPCAASLTGLRSGLCSTGNYSSIAVGALFDEASSKLSIHPNPGRYFRLKAFS